MFGGVAAIAVATPSFTWANGCVPQATQTECDPNMPANLVGTDHRTPLLRPTFCTSDHAHDLMTLQEQGEQWVRLSSFSWSYGLMYPNGSTQFYRVQVRNRRCWDRQRFHAGTRAVMWMNCLSRHDGHWYRYWYITRPIVDSGSDYTLDLYHVEPARSYEDAPTSVPPFQGLIG
jgi:hypothetical protein